MYALVWIVIDLHWQQELILNCADNFHKCLSVWSLMLKILNDPRYFCCRDFYITKNTLNKNCMLVNVMYLYGFQGTKRISCMVRNGFFFRNYLVIKSDKPWNYFNTNNSDGYGLCGENMLIAIFSLSVLENYVHLLSTALLRLFQSSSGSLNPLSKAKPGIFHSSGGHIKYNCLQDWADFHRSRAWQIALIFTTVMTSAGPRLNIKTVLSTYGDFHVKDKTAVRTSYL